MKRKAGSYRQCGKHIKSFPQGMDNGVENFLKIAIHNKMLLSENDENRVLDTEEPLSVTCKTRF